MSRNFLSNLTTIITGTTAVLFLSQTNIAEAITLTTFSPIGFNDEIAGITELEIEDFEDTTLISGLTIEWTSPDLGPINNLPLTYNPNSQGFNGNAWDGNLTLNNTRQQPYLSTPISTTTTFNFIDEVTSVGLGISNLQFTGLNSSILVVNGIDFADFDDFMPSPILGTTGQSIYIKLDANSDETITSIGIRGGIDDFLTFDRLAINNSPQSVPESSNILGIGFMGLLGIFFTFKTRK